MAEVSTIKEIKVELLKPYEKNAKLHSKQQIEQIAESIKEFGFLSPCLIDKDYNLIAGHGRVESAKLLGMETVPCVLIEGLSEEQKRAYILADNRLTELGGWDMQVVADELDSLKEAGFNINLTGFNIDNIEIKDDFAAEEIEDEEEYDSGAEINRGEIWILGNHRLMCGDSTDIYDLENLMGGAMADLLLTDPPYNVDIRNSQGMAIENDNMGSEDFEEFLQTAFINAAQFMKEGASFYVWYASRNAPEFIEALKFAGLEPRQQLIWIKSSIVLGRQDYNWKHEPCLYGWKEGASHYFIDIHSFGTTFGEEKLEELDREQLISRIKQLTSTDTVIYEHKPMKNDIHPTMKPVALIKKLVRNSSREGEKVLDLFGGSGSTIMACEEMNRICYTMEYDPKYCKAIIDRWEQETGAKAVLLDE